MTPDVLLWIWGITFFIAAIPGAILGWIFGAIFGPGIASLISLAISVFVSLLAHALFPGVADLENVVTFAPPLLLAGLLGVLISRVTAKA